MVLVLFLLFILLLVIILLISTIKINITKLEVSNEYSDTPEVKEIEVSIGVYILNKLKIFEKHIDKEKLKQMKKSKNIDKIKNKLLNGDNIKDKKKNIKFDLSIIKQLKVKLHNIDLELELGTEDVILTSFLICIIAIAISMVLAKTIEKYDENKYKYKILPIYNSKNSIKIALKSIISIKLVNIISIIFRLFFRSDEIDKRTSDRRTYANSNEQYSRNDRCKYNYRGTN